MMDFFHNLWRLRLYVALVLLAYGGYVWAGLTGTRLLGDDVQSRETVNGTRHGNSFSGGHGAYYHK